MHAVKVDMEKNRLYITLGTFEGDDEMLELALKMRDATNQLQKGFNVITDLRDYKVMGKKFEDAMQGIQMFLVDSGLGTVVRVVRKFGAWGHMQLDKGAMNIGYHAEYVNTLEEALAIIDRVEKENK